MRVLAVALMVLATSCVHSPTKRSPVRTPSIPSVASASAGTPSELQPVADAVAEVLARREDFGALFQCVDALSRALAAGASSSDMVVVSVGGGHRRLTLNEATDVCREGLGGPGGVRLRLLEADRDIASIAVLAQRSSASEDVDDDARLEAEDAAVSAASCRRAVAQALSDRRVTGEERITLPHSGEVTLAGAAEKVCEPLAAAAQKVLVVERLKGEQVLAPYKRTLRGAKRDVFLAENLIVAQIRARGGGLLSTPGELQQASVWFVVSTTQGQDGRTWWTLRCYRFNRKHALTDMQQSSGCCEAPPKTLYR